MVKTALLQKDLIGLLVIYSTIVYECTISMINDCNCKNKKFQNPIHIYTFTIQLNQINKGIFKEL